MAIITWPSQLAPGAGSGFGQLRFDQVFVSDTTGAEQARVYGPPRWSMQLVQPQVLPPLAAGAWQAVIIGLRGKVNHLLAWDFGRQQPIGTLRGSLALAGQAAKGATSCIIGGAQVGATLLPGDRLQLGTGLGTSQVVMCMAAAQAVGGGLITVQFEPPLRTSMPVSTIVAWNKPSTYFKLSVARSNWTYINGRLPYMAGASLDLVESWQ